MTIHINSRVTCMQLVIERSGERTYKKKILKIDCTYHTHQEGPDHSNLLLQMQMLPFQN